MEPSAFFCCDGRQSDNTDQLVGSNQDCLDSCHWDMMVYVDTYACIQRSRPSANQLSLATSQALISS